LHACRSTLEDPPPNKAGSESVHGAPLGPEEVKLTKQNLGWPLEPEFYIPDEVLAHFRQAIEKGVPSSNS
jgi:transketolase (EC 2.2.1.1)